MITKGEARGQTYGKIQTLEEFLGKEASSNAELSTLEADELNLKYEDLHRQYRQKFKGE